MTLKISILILQTFPCHCCSDVHIVQHCARQEFALGFEAISVISKTNTCLLIWFSLVQERSIEYNNYLVLQLLSCIGYLESQDNAPHQTKDDAGLAVHDVEPIDANQLYLEQNHQ